MEKPSPLSDAFNFIYFSENSSQHKTNIMRQSVSGNRTNGFRDLVMVVFMDILFNAQVNPRTKIENLSAADIERLYTSLKTTLREMTELGGRNPEKDLFGPIRQISDTLVQLDLSESVSKLRQSDY
jgi:formamidopyrimidine-DNA glycosylase